MTVDPFWQSMQRWMEVFMRRSMSNFRQYLKENGFSMSQMTSMFHILHRGNCSISDLAEHLAISNAAASQLTERLVQQGLLTRSENPSDRRNKLIVLTEKGRQTAQESMQARQAWVQELAGSLSEPEKQQVIAALDLLTERIKQLAPADDPICSESNS